MDAIEKAIRAAFEKGDAEDRAFREKVYRSAFAVLDRALQAQPGMTVEAAIKRRKTLQNRIAEIETEFLPAVTPQVELDESPDATESGAAPQISVDAPAVHDEAVMAVETPQPSVDLGLDNVPAPSDEVATPEEIAEFRAEGRAERRRPFAAMFFAVTLIAAAAAGGWWAYRTGVFKSAAEIDTSVHSPPQTVVEEDFDPADETDADAIAEAARNWITVFSPDDPSHVNAPEGATAEVSQDESGSFLRITSGASGAAVVFDVGQGVLEQIAGRKAVFDIAARGAPGSETQISVSCNFGELGDCGRKRYAVGYERAEYLFDVQLPSQAPGASGSIAINSDFAKEGKSVDIYEIRVSVTP